MRTTLTMLLAILISAPCFAVTKEDLREARAQLVTAEIHQDRLLKAKESYLKSVTYYNQLIAEAISTTIALQNEVNALDAVIKEEEAQKALVEATVKEEEAQRIHIEEMNFASTKKAIEEIVQETKSVNWTDADLLNP